MDTTTRVIIEAGSPRELAEAVIELAEALREQFAPGIRKATVVETTSVDVTERINNVVSNAAFEAARLRRAG